MVKQEKEQEKVTHIAQLLTDELSSESSRRDFIVKSLRVSMAVGGIIAGYIVMKPREALGWDPESGEPQPWPPPDSPPPPDPPPPPPPPTGTYREPWLHIQHAQPRNLGGKNVCYSDACFVPPCHSACHSACHGACHRNRGFW